MRCLYPILSLFLFYLTITNAQRSSIDSLKFIGEYILDNKTYLEGNQVGGLSGIDYKNKKWIAICDDSDSPRYFDLNIEYTDTTFLKVNFLKQHILRSTKGGKLPKEYIDPESIRFAGDDYHIISSEGNINNKVDSEIFLVGTGASNIIGLYSFNTFKSQKKIHLRHNGAIEALSILNNKLWFTTELPFVNDGKAATFKKNGAPVRITYFDIKTKQLKQYAYLLEKVVLAPKNKKDIAINGVVEILNINKTSLLVLERSYTFGYKEGGTHIKLFKVTINNATEVSKFKSLKNKKITLLKKKLILNFNTVKNQFPSRQVDNIEGMCWGPKLKNGNKTLVFVADNNFNLYGKQLNQFLAFEVISNTP